MHQLLPILQQSPVEHAWVIQDLTLWPERSRTYWKGSAQGVSYVHLSGHPSSGRHPVALLCDNGGELAGLLGHLPDGPFVVRETPAGVRGLLARRYPGAQFYEEQRLQVTAAAFRPRPAEGVRRLTAEDVPLLLAFTGAPPQAAGDMLGWIRGALVLARVEGERIASMGTTIVRSPAVWHLAGIETKPEFRGRGFAAAVTSELTRLALAEAACATLTVLNDNEPARRLYAGLGYGHYLDEIWMDHRTGSRP